MLHIITPDIISDILAASHHSIENGVRVSLLFIYFNVKSEVQQRLFM